MAKMIKKAEQVTESKPKIGDTVNFKVLVPEQNIGYSYELRKGKVIKVNRKTVDVTDSYSNTWRVNLNEIV